MATPRSPVLTAPVLVIGATGMLGRPVAEHMRDAGVEVRVLSRSPTNARAQLGEGFDYRPGDVEDGPTLDAALAGCGGVHVNLRGTSFAEAIRVEAEGTARVARAAARAGAHLTYLSGAGVDQADPAHFPVRIKQAAEASIRDSGASYTILRATHFMESLDMFIRGNAAVIPGHQPHRWHYLAASDYAAQVLKAHGNRAARGRAFTLLGPEALTMREALTRYVAALMPEARVREMPLPLLRLIARATRNRQLAMVAALFEAFRQIPEGRDPGNETQEVLGPAHTDLASWLNRRRDAARGQTDSKDQNTGDG